MEYVTKDEQSLNATILTLSETCYRCGLSPAQLHIPHHLQAVHWSFPRQHVLWSGGEPAEWSRCLPHWTGKTVMCMAVILITVSPWSRTCHNHYYVLLFLQINHCHFYFFQNAFFHSPQVDASLILVTELTATCEHCAASFPALHHSYTAVMESWEWKSYILQVMWGPD